MAAIKKQTPAPKPKRAKKSENRLWSVLFKHILIAGFAFVMAGLTFVIVMNWIVLPLYQKSGVEISTPKITGESLNNAKKIAMKNHMSVVVDSLEYHNTIPKDIISFQYPLHGTLVKPGRVLHATISKGAKPVPMPLVVGMPQRNAEFNLKESGLEIERIIEIPSNTHTRGIVAGQVPEGGKEVPENTRVVLYISNGLPETNVTMPNLIELSLAAAKDTLGSYDFNLNFLEIHYEDAPELLPETVIDQHPDPGKLTNTNSIITLDVSKAQ